MKSHWGSVSTINKSVLAEIEERLAVLQVHVLVLLLVFCDKNFSGLTGENSGNGENGEAGIVASGMVKISHENDPCSV